MHRDTYVYGVPFGLPIISQVIKEGLEYDQLYQLIVGKVCYGNFLNNSGNLFEMRLIEEPMRKERETY